MKIRSGYTSVALALCASAIAGCAQEVGTIDRTQPEALLKADFDGEWYIRQTISDVPATSGMFFIGYTLATEKIVWEITEDHLIGYRSYALIPGADTEAQLDAEGEWVTDGSDPDRRDENLFRDQPIVAYPILSHFDIQRQYNSSTGEQTNVLVENTTDRDWYDRDYFRVDWSTNVVASYSFLADRVAIDTPTAEQKASWVVPENEGGIDARRMERAPDGSVAYMDFTERMIAEPSFTACIYFSNGIGLGDCTGQEIEVRTSILRVPEESDYEPVAYDDRLMDKFGYFRTERLAYDRERGITLEGRIQLANRHNIWTNTWQRDAAGNVVVDADGKPVARPFAERTPQPIVYHLSSVFPEPMLAWAAGMAAEWDRALRRTVAAAQNAGDDSGWESVQPMFVLCHNPVQETPLYPDGDAGASVASACGTAGTEIRIGDLRYNVAYWVDNPQLASPLGYGPSAADPETGEIISGTAYVYGASVDTYAQVSLDMVRFINGDITDADLLDPEFIRDEIRDGRSPAWDPRTMGVDGLQALANQRITADVLEVMPAATQQIVRELRIDAQDGSIDRLRGTNATTQTRIAQLRAADLDLLALGAEDAAGHGIAPGAPISDAQLEQIRLATTMQTGSRAALRAREMALSRECVWMPESLDDSILGIARTYEGRTDYDVIYQEIRGLIFKAVLEHEVGHTLGLRHNFAGSWDSLNYFDTYWDAKAEGYPSSDDAGQPTIKPFGELVTFADLWGIASQTDAQITSRMREVQYSSIMDYSSSFNTDFGGVGRYDEAAILFAYTTGADGNQSDASAPGYNEQRPGYVEVFRDVPQAAIDIFSDFPNPLGIGFYQPYELYHYTTLVSALGDTPAEGIAQLRERDLVKWEDVLDGEIGANDMEVPYMFCSDEYNGTRQFCRTWDRGADAMEQTMDYIERYRTFYYFDNYRRERAGWFPSSVYSRAAGRLFFPLVQGYQEWLLTVAINGGRPDAGLDNQWTLSAYAGINLLAEAATTPNPGSYILNEDGTQFDLASYSELEDLDLFVPEGPGRRRYSRYDATDGYYYANFPISAGHYWTYMAALSALTSTEATVAGVEVGQFDTSYIIPPFLVFPDELTRLFNGLATGDNYALAPLGVPTSTGYEFIRRPLVTLALTNGTLLNPETGAVVEPELVMSRDRDLELPYPVIDINQGFSESVQAMIYSLLFFDSNYSTRFADQARIVEYNAGEVPSLAPGFEVVSFCDPTRGGTGKCYATWRPENAAEVTLGEQYMLAGQAYAQAWADASADGDANGMSSAEQDLNNLLSDMNILITLVDILGPAFN